MCKDLGSVSSGVGWPIVLFLLVAVNMLKKQGRQ